MPEVNLDRMFKSACGFIAHNNSSCSSSQLLQLYGLYKQATEGDIQKNFITIWFSIDPKIRAWSANRGMAPTIAKIKYIEFLENLNLGWSKENYESHGNLTNGMGICPSTMRSSIKEPTTSFEIFYNAVRKGDIEKVQQIIDSDPIIAGTRDTTNGTAMHWAADSNQYQLIPLLFKKGFNVTDTDDEGQTPLHLAAICDYPLTVAALLEIGANPNVKDSDGTTPLEIINDSPALKDLPKFIGLSY